MIPIRKKRERSIQFSDLFLSGRKKDNPTIIKRKSVLGDAWYPDGMKLANTGIFKSHPNNPMHPIPIVRPAQKRGSERHSLEK